MSRRMVTLAVTADTRPLQPLALSHHSDRQAERCLGIGRWSVCLRCTAIVTAVAVTRLYLEATASGQPPVVDLLFVALCVPAVAEFALVSRGLLAYSRRRVLLVDPPVGILLAVAAAQAGAGDGWLPLVAAGAVGAALALLGTPSALRGRMETSRG